MLGGDRAADREKPSILLEPDTSLSHNATTALLSTFLGKIKIDIHKRVMTYLRKPKCPLIDNW